MLQEVIGVSIVVLLVLIIFMMGRRRRRPVIVDRTPIYVNRVVRRPWHRRFWRHRN